MFKRQIHSIIIKRKAVLAIVSLVLLFVGCERWDETDNVSHISYLPEFEILDGEYLSYRVDSVSEFSDPGVIATENGDQLRVYSFGDVDLSNEGVYIIVYYSENSDGLFSLGRRVVVVRDADVSDNDLSGDYVGGFSGDREMKVKKINDNGFYKCDEVLGFATFEMPGEFVDLGDNKLVLLPGEGELGRYALTEGEYGRSALFFSIYLLDEPNTGIEVDAAWRKLED